MISLLGHCRTNDCIEVYFTGSILNYDADAFTCVSGIVVDRDSGDHVLAHELGHALGLHDIYHHLPGVDSIGRKAMFRLKERRNVVEVGYFSSRVKDWGYEHGRGFYEQCDVLASVIDKLLMHGLYADGAGDIPDGCVHGLSKAHNKGFQNVGAGDIKKENWSVFSK